jgi:hypothetical protein
MLGLAVVVGGAFGAYWYLSSGPQPAEALPDTTIAYVSIDLDPSGAQKIEALRTLKKFPALADQLDFNTDDDIRQRLFEEFRADLDCPGLDYGDDISPWLGDRAALAAVDIGETDPAAVFVLQVQDADDADAGLSKIRDCSSVGAGGWAINGDWAVVAETDDIAKTVSDSAEAASLADDDDYQKWTTAAGDQGIVTMYAAPAAGRWGWGTSPFSRSCPTTFAPPSRGSTARRPRSASTTAQSRWSSPAIPGSLRPRCSPVATRPTCLRGSPTTPLRPWASVSPTAGSATSSTRSPASLMAPPALPS